MSISKLSKNIEKYHNKFPPVNEWNPKLCEGEEFYIDRNGNWFHNSSIIKNERLINLFSRIIRKDELEYFLVTPFEKVPLKVELAPYKIINFDIFDNNIKLYTNLNFNFILDKINTMRLIKHNNSLIPLVVIRDNIEGFFDRNIYYNLINYALENNFIDNKELYILSKNIKYKIGEVD